MSAPYFEPTTEILTISSSTAVLSKKYDVKKFSTACFHVEYGSGFTADFRVLGANKNTSTFADTGITINSAAGTAGASLAQLSGIACAYVQFEVVASVGTGTMTLTFGAKE